MSVPADMIATIITDNVRLRAENTQLRSDAEHAERRIQSAWDAVTQERAKHEPKRHAVRDIRACDHCGKSIYEHVDYKPCLIGTPEP